MEAMRLLVQVAVTSALLMAAAVSAQLRVGFYDSSCPAAEIIVQQEVSSAVAANPGLAAGLLRLHFHDCFVGGCEASVLVDSTASNTAEKDAGPNKSLRGFEVIDRIKARVEQACFGVVSCADILALTARDGTFLLGGPSWSVPLGRRDSRGGNQSLANDNLPAPDSNLTVLIELFGRQGLSPAEMTTLSGAHTIGFSQCLNFRDRIYNDANISPSFAALRRQTCPRVGGNTTLAPIDVQTPGAFDTDYYQNLLTRRGLFRSDQALFNGGSQDALVRQYSFNPALFRRDFAAAMIKMGNICPLTGDDGEIRANCHVANS